VEVYRPNPLGNGSYEYSATVPAPPAGLSALARFGYAIASPPWLNGLEPPADEPWLVDLYTEWVAIGAPGEDQVHIYSVAIPSGALTWMQSLHASPHQIDKGFGAALAVGDFDNDCQWDLAVGAPFMNTAGTDLHGRVAVYRGLGGGTFDVSPGSVLELDGRDLWITGLPEEDHFGVSLAAGRLLTNNGGADNLIVGAPLIDWGTPPGEEGGLCWYALDIVSGTALSSVQSVCEANPFYLGGMGANNHFGAAVRAVNVLAEDEAGRVNTAEALVKELVVSEPGFPNGVGDGRVISFLTLGGGAGPEFTKYVAELTEPSLGQASFGHALGSGYTQDSYWPDLAIGGRATSRPSVAPQR